MCTLSIFVFIRVSLEHQAWGDQKEQQELAHKEKRLILLQCSLVQCGFCIRICLFRYIWVKYFFTRGTRASGVSEDYQAHLAYLAHQVPRLEPIIKMSAYMSKTVSLVNFRLGFWSLSNGNIMWTIACNASPDRLFNLCVTVFHLELLFCRESLEHRGVWACQDFLGELLQDQR